MADVKCVNVLFQWVHVSPDPVQFKPYNPQFEPQGVFIEVPVPERYVKSNTKGKIVLSAEGMAYACKHIATKLMSAHTNLNS